MKNLLSDISQEEKNRILEMHKFATSKLYIKEQDDEKLVKNIFQTKYPQVIKMAEYAEGKIGSTMNRGLYFFKNSEGFNIRTSESGGIKIPLSDDNEVTFTIMNDGSTRIVYVNDFGVDPKPIRFPSTLEEFKKWFDGVGVLGSSNNPSSNSQTMEYKTDDEYLFTHAIGMNKGAFLAIPVGTKFKYEKATRRVLGSGVIGVASYSLILRNLDWEEASGNKTISIYFDCKENKFKPIDKSINNEIFDDAKMEDENGGDLFGSLRSKFCIAI